MNLYLLRNNCLILDRYAADFAVVAAKDETSAR